MEMNSKMMTPEFEAGSFFDLKCKGCVKKDQRV